MEPWQAFILGVIEGITEYLPVSSTGHLLVAQHLLGIGTATPTEKAAADTFAICIQGGAILAVLGIYMKRVLQMLRGVIGQDREGLKLAMMLLAGFLPAAIIGLLFNDKIEEKLFGMWPVIIAWIVGGVMILATAWWRKRNPAAGNGMDLCEMTLKMALLIGLLQCVAMWPGTSRSLMTIVGGLLCGLNLIAAVEFSFLLGMITLTAAAGYKFLKNYSILFETYSIPSMLLGCFAAWLSATLAVKWMVGFLQRRGLQPFGYYRIGLAVLVAILIMTKVLQPEPAEAAREGAFHLHSPAPGLIQAANP